MRRYLVSCLVIEREIRKVEVFEEDVGGIAAGVD